MRGVTAACCRQECAAQHQQEEDAGRAGDQRRGCRRAHRRHYLGVPIRSTASRVAGPALAGVLVVLWVIVYPHTPDLAAQVYRVGLFEKLGFIVWDEHWYAGHHMPGYSLLFPPLGALLGVRTIGAICAVTSTILFGALMKEDFGPGARYGTIAFAVVAVGDIWLGRLAFALGVTLALAAGLALRRGRTAPAVLLALCCAAASPVAGLLLGLAGLTVSLYCRSPRAVLALGLPAAAVVVPLALLFPEGGHEPFPLISFCVAAIVAVAFLVAVPHEAGLLRTGGIVYLAACLLCLVLRTPIGSNIERYGVLLAGPLLICAAFGAPRDGQAKGHRMSPALGLALGVIALWVLWGPVRETEAVAGSPATQQSFYTPLIDFLDGQPGGPFRIEVPLTRTHWEAALLAPSVSLARGWEKQLDTRYDGVLLRPGLTPKSYRAWLNKMGVTFVALPDVEPDPSSAAEARLIGAGLPYLRPVFSEAGWQVFRVVGATPVASGPGHLTELGHDSFALHADRAGGFLVRIHFTRYWTITAGSGCVERGPEGFTGVFARRAGDVRVAARFSLGRAFGAGGTCRAG